MLKMALVVSILLLAAQTATATPSTQIWIPSPDLQPFMLGHIGADIYFGNQHDDAGGAEHDGGFGGLHGGTTPMRRSVASPPAGPPSWETTPSP